MPESVIAAPAIPPLVFSQGMYVRIAKLRGNLSLFPQSKNFNIYNSSIFSIF